MSPRGARPRPIAALALLALMTLVASACSSTPAPTAMTLAPVSGGTITVGIDQAPTGCNPNTPAGATWADQLILEAVLPSTFIVTAQGQAIGNSALMSAEVISSMPQTVQYNLNPRATWSDGTAINAEDFVYTWQQQRSAVDSASTAGYRDIKSVTGSDHGETVKVVFSTHFADWRVLFNDLLPAHVLRHTGWDPACRTLDPAVDLSGGPFEIHSVTTGEVDLVANPHWWGQAPQLSHLDFLVAQSDTQLAQWLAAGRVQVAEPTGSTGTLLADLDAQPRATTNVVPSSTFLQLEFSTTSAVTGTLAVREAIAHAVDRQSLVNAEVGWADSDIVPAASHIYSQADPGYPHASPSGLPNSLDDGNVPTTTAPGSAPTSTAPFPTTAEPAVTARLLTTAGYISGVGGVWSTFSGSPMVLHLAVDEGDAWAVRTATALESQLTRAGFSVAPVAEPSTTATGEALSTGIADLAVLPMTSTTYPSQAAAWYTTLLGPPGVGGSQDWTNFSSPALDSLLTQASQLLNPVDGAPLYHQADMLLWSQMIALPLFDEPTVIAISNSVYGVGPNPYGAGLLWFPSTWQVQKLQPTTDTTS